MTAPPPDSPHNTLTTTGAHTIFYSCASRRPCDVRPSTHISLSTLKT